MGPSQRGCQITSGVGGVMPRLIFPAPVQAALYAMAATLCFSLNDASIKFISGGYALHQIVLFRSVIGLVILCGVFIPLAGSFSVFRTNRLGMHLLRGLCVVFANLCFFLGLASLELAEGTALFFVSPLLITVFSVIFLKEVVGRHRWLSVCVGLVGIVIILRPGTDAFQLASLLPLGAATAYACLHMLTRYIGKTESAQTMSFYIQLTFVIVCSSFGVIAGGGQFSGFDNPSLEFMFRAWTVPDTSDYLIFLIIGVASAFGGFFISQAYRMAEAGYVAPFEYIAMPLALFWGASLFGEWPDGWSLTGMCLIVGAGLYIVWREAVNMRHQRRGMPHYRR